MLHVASVCTPCCMLLDVVGSCCAKFVTDQTFQPTTPNISFVPWSPKSSATMLNPFAQLLQHCWGHARSLRMDYKDLWVVFFPRCTAGPNIVGSCCIRLHTTANTHATTPTLLAQPWRWELLRPFARSLTTQRTFFSLSFSNSKEYESKMKSKIKCNINWHLLNNHVLYEVLGFRPVSISKEIKLALTSSPHGQSSGLLIHSFIMN